MEFEVYKLSDTLYQFNEAADFDGSGNARPYVDAYLLIGDERAAIVDTLQNARGLYGKVRELTELPVDVLITHGHWDHVGVATEEFAEAGCKVYMSMKDYAGLAEMSDFVKKEWFTDVKDGDVMDLGGRKLEVIGCGGHTPGSVVYLDRENQLMFSGDSIGSGNFWLQLPNCLAMNLFQMNVAHLYDEVKGLERLLIYPGHRNQSPVQLTGQYVKDTYIIATRVVNGTLEGEDRVMDFLGRHMEYKSAAHGQMLEFCYDPANLNFQRPDPAVEAVKDQFRQDCIREGSRVMDYMIFTPEVQEGERYPLVLYLHGAGERGNEPRVALANSGAYTFAGEDWQKKHPCYVVAPQVAENEWWTDEGYISLLVKCILVMPQEKGLAVDMDRIYITGLSMGGMGTWAAIGKCPGLFAAAMPICGAGDPFGIRAAKDVPVWAFHAADDPVVPAHEYCHAPFEAMAGTARLVESLRGAGNTKVRYTEYPAGWMEEQGMHPHASWVPAYGDEEAKEWLFAQKKSDRYEIHWVMPGFYWIEDDNNDSIYVIEGGDRALVVDTGLAKNDFIGMVKSLTRLPFDLAVTHNHGDHMYHLDKFERYYMSEKDYGMFGEPFMKQMLGDRDFSKSTMIPVKDGDIIDLGGGYEVEVFELNGHTPGSVVYLDKKRKIALTGDALGVWMQVPCATCLSEYQAQLEHFLERMSAPEYEGVCMMGGHRKQEGGYFPFGEQYVPNDLQKVRDMITLCKKLLAEEIEFAPFTMRTFGRKAYTAQYGQASMVFDEDKLK